MSERYQADSHDDGAGVERLARIIYEADSGPKHGCDSPAFDDLMWQRPWLMRAQAVLKAGYSRTCPTCETGMRETVGLRCPDCGRDWSDAIESLEDLRSTVGVAVQRAILNALMRGEMPDDTAMIDALVEAMTAAGYQRVNPYRNGDDA